MEAPASPRQALGGNLDRRQLLGEGTGSLLSFGTLLASSLYLAASSLGLLPFSPSLAAGVAALGFVAALAACFLYLRVATSRAQLEGARSRLGKQTRMDPLTGLLNRGAFLEAFDAARAAGKGPVSVLFIDLDKFKDVNDTLGHRAGDEVLIEIANRCRRIVGDDNPLARLGGDEFATLFAHGTRRPVEEIGQAVVDLAGQPMVIDGKLVTIGASVGIASGDLETDSTEDLLRRADLAMYDAKGSPHGAFRIFDDALSSRQSLESSIRVALANPVFTSEMTMVYQPVIDARTGKLESAEALLRWRSREIGDVSPSTLIPIAEASGHIDLLTEWTLDKVFETIRRLDGAGIAVNISPIYFKHPEFVHRIFDRLLAAQVRPDLLTLEITEGILISNMDRAQQAIARLRDVGVRIFLDDFGTGYSSLSYLQNFELDGLKLDKSFLRNVGEKRQATQIIRTMINFGHSLDMKVVVEGVENEWQARLLQLIGCDLLQGFELGVPMTLDDLLIFRDCNALQGAQETPFDEAAIADHLQRLSA